MINGRTRLIGIIGYPISHTFSPAMHNAAAQALGLNVAYVPLPVPPEGIETAVSALPFLGFLGVNVTVPHKQSVMPLLDEVEAGVQAIGAVNTIEVQAKNDRFRLKGHNTDWAGFLADLDAQGISVDGRSCLVLGAGGSARAVVYALLTRRARVHVLSRRPAQAEALARHMRQHLPQSDVQSHDLTQLAQVSAETAVPLIVNTTPLGMSPHVNNTVWPDAVPFPAGAVVYDLVYNPPKTRLMQQAAAAGCRTFNGLGMLVYQGALAFTLWTGAQPDAAVMRQALMNE
ncbi:MAG: shikimate dehydrogenase [Candidatus Promineifilaceae bacterium]